MVKKRSNETRKNGRGQIRLRIDADKSQLERALRQLTEEGEIEIAIAWNQAVPKPYARRLPVLEHRGSRIRYVKVSKIDWIEAERQYIRLHVGSETFLARGQGMTIKSLSSRLAPEQFMQVHRSHIVNLERVVALRVDTPAKRYAILTEGHEVPVSLAHWDLLQETLGGVG